MSKTYDSTLRFLLDRYPEDWLRLIGAPGTGPVEILETKLTQAFEADKIFRAANPQPHLYHLEYQATNDEHLPERILVYNTLALRQHRLPVHSVAILLRPQADGPAMTGHVVRERIQGDRYLDFRYDVIRVWKLNWRDVAAAGVGALPLDLDRRRGARSSNRRQPTGRGRAEQAFQYRPVRPLVRRPPDVGPQVLGIRDQ